MADIQYELQDDINEIFDERGNTVLAMRKVAWGGKAEGKLELRKWYVDIEKETPNRGFSFLTEEGPHNLVDCLVKHGYGETKTILKNIKDRDDFNSSLSKVLGKEATESLGVEYIEEDGDEFYDPKEALF